MTEPGKRIGCGGCLAMLVFLALIVGVFLLGGYLGWVLLTPVIVAVVPSSVGEVSVTIAIIIGLVVACWPAFALDRLGKRLFGESVLDNVSNIPNFP